jgi:hypothetical protein
MIGALATWRLTSLFVSEAGPYDIFGKLRDWLGVYHDDYSQAHGTNEVARALTCIWCASVWIGGGVALAQGYRLPNVILRALAYSAGTILIDRWLHAR